jgi:hypothetical protein
MNTEWASFEERVAQVLEAKGFVAQLTQRTSDGGIDVIAHRQEPLLRGKYVVQCKKWTNPVGVNVVRDLYGAMTHERASKGIIITTSSFTQGAIDFAQDKPLELIDGEQWRDLLADIGLAPPPQPESMSRAQLAQGIIDTFEELSVWARRSMTQVDYTAQEEPQVSHDLSVSGKEDTENYRHTASDTIVSFRQVLNEMSQRSKLLKQVMNRWAALKETGYESELDEELEQLGIYRHHISGYQHLFEEAYDIYEALRKVAPPTILAKPHADALEGMYYGLSAVLTLFITRPAKQYDGTTVHLDLSAPQELLSHYAKKYHELTDAALEGLQASRTNRWLRRILGP